ncbi:MAG: hydroxymethylbilane synthase [Saprospiraceae bacterium]
MTVKIGIQPGLAAAWLAEFACGELRQFSVESTVVQLDDPEAAILRGEVDLAVHPLAELPLARLEGTVIAAVSERKRAADLLVLRLETRDEKRDFGLKNQAAVFSDTVLQAAQLRDYRPDVAVSVPGGGAAALLEQVRNGGCDAAVFAAAYIEPLGLNLAGVEVIELSPQEFVPAPGQGVLAWLAHCDDLPLRRVLQRLHHPEVSACTNVERRVLQLFGGEGAASIGVFVERDGVGNFHAFAASERSGQMLRARVSQSTNIELAVRVAGRLG